VGLWRHSMVQKIVMTINIINWFFK
jgi:hypothetical protein